MKKYFINLPTLNLIIYEKIKITKNLLISSILDSTKTKKN